MDADELRTLVDSWVRALRAENKSPNTIALYTAGARAWLDYCDAQGLEPLTRDALREFTVSMQEAGRKPGTVRARWNAARRYVRWLHAEDELDADPFLNMKPPADEEPERKPLSVAELQAMLSQCDVTRGAPEMDRFLGRRDEAALRMFIDSGMRAFELLALQVPNNSQLESATFDLMGKGKRRRTIAYGDRTAAALDRYMRVRAKQPHASEAALWLGWNRGPLSYQGLSYSLRLRARAAGVDGFHVHRMRHTFADRWLSAGGSERDLMTTAGWSRHEQLAAYTKGRASERAREEARRLNLGEL